MSSEPFKIEARMILQSRTFLVIFSLLAGIFSPLAVVSVYANNQHTDEFLALTILNEDMKIGHYFAGNTTIGLGEDVKWHIKVQNGMHKSEYVTVKIKLLNSTHVGPDDSSNSPSLEQEIIRFDRIIAAGSSWTVPLNWTITDTEIQDNYVVIKGMILNDKEIDGLDIRSIEGKNLRIVIELWKYDTNISDFTFAWSSSTDKIRSVWNQIWFSVES